MAARLLMVAGTMSGVGKSTLVAALCRLLAGKGVAVAPFKAQNMSLNAAVTPDGAEISRAQAFQAQAAGVVPVAAMNPILLKPEAPDRCQVVVMGRPWRSLRAAEYYRVRDELRPVVLRALAELAARFDVVLIEGAGGAAELNLRDGDFVNLGLAREVGAPALLVGDIERGGIFAQLLGTLALLSGPERERVWGLVVNKFRGDPALFAEGVRILEARSGLHVWGVLPYLQEPLMPAEDSLDLDRLGGGGARAASPAAGASRAADASPDASGAPAPGGAAFAGAGAPELVPALDIAVVGLPHIANFDEFEPLAAEPDVRLRLVREAAAVGFPDLLVLPGSKSTLADLAWLRQAGLDRVIRHVARLGVPVLGICGGYQMLGLTLEDPDGAESTVPVAGGIGLLPVRTRFVADKVTRQVRGRVAAGGGLWAAWAGLAFEAYEIHMGRTTVADPFAIGAGEPLAAGTRRLSGIDGAGIHRPSGTDEAGTRQPSGAEGPVWPWMRLVRRPGGEAVEDGCVRGNVAGTYCHGLLANAGLRTALLEALWRRRGLDGRPVSALPASGPPEPSYERLARWAGDHLDLARLGACLGLRLQ